MCVSVARVCVCARECARALVCVCARVCACVCVRAPACLLMDLLAMAQYCEPVWPSGKALGW